MPSANAGERENLCRANRQSRLIQSGCEAHKERFKSPHGARTKARLADRVKGSTGSCNVRWRREPGGGNTDPPEADHLRGSAENADREQLNDERGVKPLPVSRSRDAAESGNDRSGWVRSRFCILASEIIPPVRDGNCGEAGVSRIPDGSGRTRPTYVTAVAKNQTNRATSVAAGVVSGAGLVRRCFKSRTRMRVLRVGPDGVWTQ